MNLLMEEDSKDSAIQYPDSASQMQSNGAAGSLFSTKPRPKFLRTNSSSITSGSLSILGGERIGSDPLSELWTENRNQYSIERYPEFPVQKYFLICKSCLWCVSSINSHTLMQDCPACHEDLDCILIEDKNTQKPERNLTIGTG
jgi:hypothetical protein